MSEQPANTIMYYSKNNRKINAFLAINKPNSQCTKVKRK